MIENMNKKSVFLSILIIFGVPTIVKISISNSGTENHENPVVSTNITNTSTGKTNQNFPPTFSNSRTNNNRSNNATHKNESGHPKRRQAPLVSPSPVQTVQLVKCQTTINEGNWIVPSTLRIPHRPPILQELRDTFGTNFYNFTFRNGSKSQEKNESSFMVTKLELHFKNNYTAHITNRNKNSLSHLYAQTLHYFTPLGYLKMNRTIHHPDNYCVSNITNRSISVEIREVKNQPTIPKCCAMGMVLTLNSKENGFKGNCSFVGNPEYIPFIYKDIFDNRNLGEGMANKGIRPFNFMYKPIPKACVRRVRTIPWRKGERSDQVLHKKIKILDNGDVMTLVSGNHRWEKLDDSSFCIDGLLDIGTMDRFNGDESQQVIDQCLSSFSHPSELQRIVSLVYLISYCIAFLFFLIILAFYGLIWRTHNIHGWTTIAFSLCGLGNALSIIMGYSISWLSFVSSGACIGLGIMGHFFNISFFAWLTVMNYDLWSTIRSMTPKSERSKGKRKFLVYCLIGFGIPTAVVTVSNIIEHYIDFFDERVIRPQYGRTQCFLDKSAVLVYAILPNTILFLFNTILALLTLKTLWEFKKGTKFLDSSQSTKKNRSKLTLFTKLCILMGFSWIFEFLSTALGNQKEKLILLWLVFDVYNAIQVIYLFWIFVCKKEVQLELCKRYAVFNAGFTFAGRTLTRWKSRERGSTVNLRVTHSKQISSKS